ncbi:alpha/beta hydrolase [Streptomyces sp. NBC_01433]|uniref:alpha/beta fold hydrolase n=1 Tax=Streptomyces sp. NBC_01433 TaxID=2903864 RepID=UPI00225594E4|nr:alpha/beta hydrolase [Streptomyces sp. NBC_01433]MCX4677427.1 alpha/beta hydrolase [Streptomyces sp. NBC_01433]
MAEDPRPIDERSRRVYAHAYADAYQAIHAGNAWYRTFNRDIADQKSYGPVTTPLLVLAGGAETYARLSELMPAKGLDTRVVRIDDCGHYIPEEQPQAVVNELTAFLG